MDHVTQALLLLHRFWLWRATQAFSRKQAICRKPSLQDLRANQ
jgi:hypothetical protein